MVGAIELHDRHKRDDSHSRAQSATATLSVASGADSATGVVESEDLEPITARFTTAPAEHDGSPLEFAFSHAPESYNWRTVQHHLFAVTGGRIEKAGRTVRSGPSRNVGWRVVVPPDGVGAVTLSRARMQTTTVDYATSDGTARAGEDYNAARQGR